MSETVKNLVLGVCALSFLAVFGTAAAGEGRLKDALKLVFALAMTAVMMAALRGGEGRTLSWLRDTELLRGFSAPREAEDVKARAESMCRVYVEEYVVKLGENMGLSCRCESGTHYEDGAFYLDFCRVYFPADADEGEKRELLSRAAQGLGTDEAYVKEG